MVLQESLDPLSPTPLDTCMMAEDKIKFLSTLDDTVLIQSMTNLLDHSLSHSLELVFGKIAENIAIFSL